jgi:hypothetical protein
VPPHRDSFALQYSLAVCKRLEFFRRHRDANANAGLNNKNKSRCEE